MEQSREPDAADAAARVIIAALAPEREMPRVTPEERRQAESAREESEYTDNYSQVKPVQEANEQLSVVLKQIEISFEKQSRSADIEALSFSLHHLFRCVDFLYYQGLPSLERAAQEQEEEGKEILQRQQIWLQAQAINRTLDRMAPLCHLLSDVIESLLDTLENEENWLRSIDEEDTLLLEKINNGGTEKTTHRQSEQSQETMPIAAAGWEQAISRLMDRLLNWQEQHHRFTPFQQQFANSFLAESGLSNLDRAFAMLLDSASAIFGDILPNFRVVMPEEREEISALLLDLMQQSDQMLVQFEITLDPLNRLLRHFAVVGENS